MFKENWISYLSEVIPISKGKIRLEKGIKIEVKEEKDFKLLVFFLKNHTYTQMKYLTEETCIDQLSGENRFKIVTILTSIFLKEKIILNSFAKERKNLLYEHSSLTSFYSSSNWLEREIWDMFGVIFLGHNELRRILTDYGFEGFPLRKDFPVIGYVELRYNETTKALVYEPIELVQEIREFQFQNPWKS